MNPLGCLCKVRSAHPSFPFSFLHAFSHSPYAVFSCAVCPPPFALLPFLPPSLLSFLLSSYYVSFCEPRDDKDAFSSSLFQVLPPQPLTSCLSFTSCPLCPSVCFAISDFINLPVLAAVFYPLFPVPVHYVFPCLLVAPHPWP